MENNVTKVVLTIEIEGRNCKTQYQRVPQTKTYFDKKLKKKVEKTAWVKETIQIPIPAYQHLNISEESYKYMISEEPYKKSSREWGRLTRKQKLEFHLNDIAKSLGGKSFTYEVLDN